MNTKILFVEDRDKDVTMLQEWENIETAAYLNPSYTRLVSSIKSAHSAIDEEVVSCTENSLVDPLTAVVIDPYVGNCLQEVEDFIKRAQTDVPWCVLIVSTDTPYEIPAQTQQTVLKTRTGPDNYTHALTWTKDAVDHWASLSNNQRLAWFETLSDMELPNSTSELVLARDAALRAHEDSLIHSSDYDEIKGSAQKYLDMVLKDNRSIPRAQ